MKKGIVVLLAVGCMALSISNKLAFASEESDEKEKGAFSMETTIQISSILLVESTGETIKKGSVSPDVVITHNPSGIYFQPKVYMTDRMEETDLALGKSFNFLGTEFDAGGSVYFVQGDQNYFALYLGAKFPEVFGLTPFAYLESVYSTTEGNNGGVVWNFGVEKSVEVFDRKFGANLMFGGNDGAYGTSPEKIAFARLSVSTEFEAPGVKLVPSVFVQKGMGGDESIAGEETLAGVMFSIKF